MAIYYIDQFGGSDAANGLSWATAWATTYPLKALYAASTHLQDVELRFAKTNPSHSRKFTFTQTSGIGSNASCAVCYGRSASTAEHRKPLVKPNSGYSYTVSDFGGNYVYPFSVTPPSTLYSPAGSGKFFVRCPASTSGTAVTFAVATPANINSMAAIEGVWVGYGHTEATTLRENVTVTLRLCSDSACTNTVWSKTVPLDTTREVDKVWFTGPFPDVTIAGVAIDINNPTATHFFFECSEIAAVRALTDPNYIGFQTAFVPKDHDSLPLVTTSIDKDQFTFTGYEGSTIDSYREYMNLPAREWDAHVWKQWPYASSTCVAWFYRGGSVNSPIVIGGGWNPATNEQDGITVLAAPNLGLFLSLRELYLNVSRIMPVFTTHTSDGALARGLSVGTIVRINAEKVYTPLGGLELVGVQVGRYVDEVLHNTLLANSFAYTGDVNNKVVMRDCWSGACPLVLLRGSMDIEDSTFGFLYPIDSPSGEFHRVTLIGTTPLLAYWYAPNTAPVWKNCKVITNAWHSYLQSGDPDACPPGHFENGSFHGAYTGPLSTTYSKDCTFWPSSNVLGAISRDGWHERLTIGRSDPSVFSTSPMFGALDWRSYPHSSVVNIKDSILPVPFATVTHNKVGASHKVNFSNVTLRHTQACVGAAFPRSALTAKDIALIGPWVTVCDGVLSRGDVDGCVISDATTTLFDNYTIPGGTGRHGRVAARIQRVSHPLGLRGVLGTPSVDVSSGACYISLLDGTSLWATTMIAVEHVATKSYAGSTSYRVRLVNTVGSPLRGSFPVGVFKLQAGQKITVKAHINRESDDVMGGLVIIPSSTNAPLEANTAQYLPIDYVVQSLPPKSAINQWHEVTVEYTAVYAGLVEVCAFARGLLGTSLFIDNIKVVK